MKIIDITGISGSGKSYILNKLKNNSEIIIIEDRFEFFKDILYIFYFFKIKYSFKVVKYTFEIAYLTNFSIFNKINFIRNVLKKFGRDIYLKNKFKNSKKIILVDEGLIHLYQNIIPNKNNKRLLTKIDNILELKDYSNKVLIIEAPKEVIKNRLLQRGHKRLDFNNIDFFIETSIFNIDNIKLKYNKNINISIFSNGSNTDINKFLKQIRDIGFE